MSISGIDQSLFGGSQGNELDLLVAINKINKRRFNERF